MAERTGLEYDSVGGGISKLLILLGWGTPENPLKPRWCHQQVPLTSSGACAELK